MEKFPLISFRRPFILYVIFPIPSQSYTTSSFPVTVKIICFLFLVSKIRSKKEKHTARGSLREISLVTAKEMKILGINVTPGDK